MVAGTVTAKLLFPGLSWWVCAVIGTAVAPTDAALGAAIIEDPRVSGRIRRVLNVESGLNDGIVTPLVNFFLIAAVAGTSFGGSSLAAAIADLALGAVYRGEDGALRVRSPARKQWPRAPHLGGGGLEGRRHDPERVGGSDHPDRAPLGHPPA